MDLEGVKVEIVWRNITVEPTEPLKEALVKRAQGKIEPSEMTVLVGVSGAGKTTMLNAIVGKPMDGLKVTGEVLLNGHPVNTDVWECAVGFVGERLHSYETQTVEETLKFAVMVSRGLGPGTSVSEEVSSLIRSLGLSRVAHTPINSVSTGERVRLSLGITLAKRPSILIIDEVTNDLDSFNIIHILKILMDLKHRGKGIIISFQRLPREILPFFDKIMVICQGEIAFSGSLEQCTSFFERCGCSLEKQVNSPDFFMEVLSIDTTTPESERESLRRIERLKMSWKRIEPLVVSSIIRKTEFPVVARKSIQNFMLVFERNLSDFSRSRGLMHILSIQRFVTLLFLVSIYYRLDYTQKGIQDRLGILSFIIMGCFEKAAFVSIIFISSHKKALKREVCAGMYGAVTSYFANMASTLCMSGIPNIFYIAVVYWIVGLNPDILRFIFFVFVFTVIVLLSTSFGIVASLYTKTLIHAQILASTVIMVFTMLGGSFVNLGSIPRFIRWATWISPVYYVLETVLQTQLENLTFECKGSERCISSGKEALNIYGFGRVRYAVSIGILLFITTVFIAFGAISMNRMIKPKNTT
ncbi:EPP-like transporter [Encephalitozoon hellem ATCC 50504]|uniref:Sterolin-1 n=1 Tax=Encephalitozoon hellem TaxID=27973 RepID=A0A9Q9F8E0_ENCHE|nr:EPP-like transporter [Encephalitozoon hellem ATCC 50504]AFM98580.1 EPP-like transporter [Encephalitozoon hellem ATCC 50504]UTX43524.1 sterolin-1 [Encephalitozoon hellem]WEL38998.1 sterolin-1 [Encephalitozoon hellem]|eukprot:XP_003887561.1 EPP-like transporter [Encephalitozoon hellem ATCC 50504]